MKVLICFFITIMLLTNYNCANAQNDLANKQPEQMLKEFYTAYNIAWSTHTAPDVHDKRLYFLQKKYCTAQLRNELEKRGGLDQDLLIGRGYTDVEHLKTLTVSKDPANANSYSVSYIHPTMDASYRPNGEEKIVIHVTVVKEGNGFKIASVK